VHAVEVGRQVAAKIAPPLRVHAHHAGAGTEHAHRGEQLRLHILARHEQDLWLPTGGLGGLHQVLPLGREQA